VVLDIVPVDEVSRRIADEASSEQHAPKDARIVYTVATLSHGAQVSTTCSACVEFFKQHRAGQSPKLYHVGHRNLKYYFYEFARHNLPFRIAKAYFGLLGDAKMRHRTERIANLLSTINDAFPPFTLYAYDFCPSVSLPEGFNIDSYLLQVFRGIQKHLIQRDPTQVLLGGKTLKSTTKGDIRWCLCKPDGNLAIRMSAVILCKAFRRMFDEFTFDQHSFDRVMDVLDNDRHRHLVMVPTHRSYVDFLVCSFLFFARPDLGIKIPHVAAAQEFSEIMGIGWLFKKLHAFYVRRGQGKADPDVNSHIKNLLDHEETLLFFIEGQRSRSRLFLPPKRGLLRGLQSTGEQFVVLPISISYDRVAEEASFLRELKGGHKKRRCDLSAWRGGPRV
jgi:1-acyl-sn-glycerol-3-phosphate acyltransferase